MKDIICWWSGGVTSAVACSLAIKQYGIDHCKVIMIDTGNEHVDTYRFKADCEKWYGIKIEIISAIPTEYNSIQDCWEKHLSLNVATGAVCSYKLKRVVRESWQKDNKYKHQVFGFEFDTKEFKRALSLRLNHPKAKPIYPLLSMGMDKMDCIRVLKAEGLEIPHAYKMGFSNNNCLTTGCVSGGIGYWKKIQSEYPEKFNKMADMEHKLTDMKGSQVTCLKDQSNEAKKKKSEEKFADLVFLKKHKKYKNKCIDEMQGRFVELLVDCNGLCGIDDLIKS